MSQPLLKTPDLAPIKARTVVLYAAPCPRSKAQPAPPPAGRTEIWVRRLLWSVVGFWALVWLSRVAERWL